MDDAQRLAHFSAEYQRLHGDALFFLRRHVGPATQQQGRDLRQRVLRYAQLVEQNAAAFPAPELEAVRIGTHEMIEALDERDDEVKDPPRIERPTVAHYEATGGRPRLVIDPGFLEEAAKHREPSAIGAILGCCGRSVRRRILDNNLAAPGPSVLLSSPHPVTGEIQYLHNDASIGRLPRTDISDDRLDSEVAQIVQRFDNHGRGMTQGQLRASEIYVPRERVRESLERVTGLPAQFGRPPIERRQYNVAGPDSLWHHDGQHGLIHWKIVIHAFIDGWSRYVLGIRASNNNRAETVAKLFCEIVGVYGFPSRSRGDHGVENLIVADLMEQFRGLGRGSYIWGPSVHNVRIERLWVDVVKGFVGKWKRFFRDLELHHHLIRSEPSHISLLHILFLDCINGDAMAWMAGWNSHTLSRVPNHAPRTRLPTPNELYTLGRVERGVRATEAVPADDIPEHELAEYGIDWEEHEDDEVMRIHWENNRQELPEPDRHPNGWSRPHRPDVLVDVRVPAPAQVLTSPEVERLYAHLRAQGLDLDSHSMDVRRLWWIHALEFCETEFPALP